LPRLSRQTLTKRVGVRGRRRVGPARARGGRR
jgi:hypothetical protein